MAEDDVSDLEQLADEMVAAGVSRAYGVPGSGATLTLVDQLERRGVPFQLVHFESSAAIMAGTAARLGAGIGVALSIKGPGLANMVPGLAVCQMESLPVIAAAEAYGPDIPVARAHKRMDQKGLTAAVAKGRRYHAKNGPAFADMASWAEREVPGPVVLELAGPVEQEEAVPDIEPAPNNFDVGAAVSAARRPLVVAGTLAIRRGWSDRLNSLSIPVFSTAAAKGVVDETLPQAAGVYTGVGLHRAPETSLLPQADLVIGLGLRAGEVLKAGPFHCPAINIDEVTGVIHAGFDFEGVSKCVDEVFDTLQSRHWGDDPARPARDLREHLLKLPFGPAHVFAAVERAIRRQSAACARYRLFLHHRRTCLAGEAAGAMPRHRPIEIYGRKPAHGGCRCPARSQRSDHPCGGRRRDRTIRGGAKDRRGAPASADGGVAQRRRLRFGAHKGDQGWAQTRCTLDGGAIMACRRGRLGASRNACRQGRRCH